MKARRTWTSLLLLGLLVGVVAGAAAAQADAGVASSPAGTEFTYQGELRDAAGPITSACDLRFKLWDADSGGGQVGSTVTLAGVELQDGRFTAVLDFGANAFQGEGRWLQILVRCPAGEGSYASLTPRQALTPAPYALYALDGAGSGGGDITAVNAGMGLSGGGDSGDVELSADTGYLQRRVTGTCAAGSSIRVIKADGTVTCEADDSGGGGGDAWLLTGNAGTTPGTHFLGTTDNKALELKVNGQRVMRFEPNNNGPNVVGGAPGNQVAAGVWGATIGGGGNAAGQINEVRGDVGTIGGGVDNLVVGAQGTVGGGFGNTVHGAWGTVAGGAGNGASGQYGAVGGGYHNGAAGQYGAVGGGFHNEADGDKATVAGGSYNSADGEYASVGGGETNQATGLRGTVGGGGTNLATGSNATVGGGYDNEATSLNATVGGGAYNSAQGENATVPGGKACTAAGNYTFAAGRRAKANHQGAFVWADSTQEDLTTQRSDQFLVRANGGAMFRVSSDYWVDLRLALVQQPNVYGIISTSTGAYLSNGGYWINASDAAGKENMIPLDEQEVLDRLSDLPVSTWNYIAEDASIRHIGPTAQDFYAAFGYGGDETAIGTIDADGVALAAIQGLYQHVQSQGEQLTAKDEQLAAQEAEIEALEERLAALEALVRELAGQGAGGAP